MSGSRGPADQPAQARILIVDDEPHNRQVLEVMLESEGFCLLTASSGEEAMAIVAREPPDLILLDVMMPGMDGYEVAAEVKGNLATKNIPIIMVTAIDDRSGRMLGLRAGAEDFLSKPVDRAELSVRVRNLLRLKAANDEAAAALVEAREARMTAEQANSAKTLFLRSMSHELRTPLNAILGYAELLALGIRGDINPAQAQDLARIQRAAAYLLRLINDLLAVARPEGTRPLQLIAIAVNPVLGEVEGLCALQAKAKGLQLSVAQCESEILVTADAGRFQQILLNLMTNAIKFTTTGGSVGVWCDGTAGMVRFRVTDTGVGIRPVDIDRVFEPFVQIESQLAAAAQQGVGLGLSISRELARAMGGDLTLQSSEGVGSTFTLTLPSALEPLLAPFERHPARIALKTPILSRPVSGLAESILH
jgi:signal transduction histidine kinase